MNMQKKEEGSADIVSEEIVVITASTTETTPLQPQRSGPKLTTPGAIVLAGIIIAGAIFITAGGTPSRSGGVKTISERAGLNENKLRACLDAGTYKDAVAASSKEGEALGIDGTPFSILMTPTGVTAVVSGALPYELWKKAIDTLPTTPAGVGSAYAFDPSTGTFSIQKFNDVRAPEARDHILGNPAAAVAIIEYSDIECPFCKRVHPVLQQLVKDYGGKVSWVYRHFPLDSLHSKARREAEATECAAAQGGNAGFWKYLDALIEATPSNDGLDLEML